MKRASIVFCPLDVILSPFFPESLAHESALEALRWHIAVPTSPIFGLIWHNNPPWRHLCGRLVCQAFGKPAGKQRPTCQFAKCYATTHVEWALCHIAVTLPLNHPECYATTHVEWALCHIAVTLPLNHPECYATTSAERCRSHIAVTLPLNHPECYATTHVEWALCHIAVTLPLNHPDSRRPLSAKHAVSCRKWSEFRHGRQKNREPCRKRGEFRHGRQKNTVPRRQVGSVVRK